MTTNKFVAPKRLAATLALSLIGWMSGAQAAATIYILNGDGPGVGFNDATAVAPVGGNPGTTLGQQRLFEFQAAADKWGATLTSPVPIKVNATWEALSCTATSAVLGSAGATEVFSDFPGAAKPATWYSFALANKLTGVDEDPGNAQIRARFNVNLEQAGCLTGTFFYLGLDNNHGANVDLVTVLTHEFGHGLGFQTFTNGNTGAQFPGSALHLGSLPSRQPDRPALEGHDGCTTCGLGVERQPAGLDRRVGHERAARRAAAGHAGGGHRRPGRGRGDG